jgi:hypothetical protein
MKVSSANRNASPAARTPGRAADGTAPSSTSRPGSIDERRTDAHQHHRDGDEEQRVIDAGHVVGQHRPRALEADAPEQQRQPAQRHHLRRPCPTRPPHRQQREERGEEGVEPDHQRQVDVHDQEPLEEVRVLERAGQERQPAHHQQQREQPRHQQTAHGDQQPPAHRPACPLPTVGRHLNGHAGRFISDTQWTVKSID